ncbi:MAG TPA: hypothetical protein VE843_08130 [Ktedonobacteraceae bacterium]|nr:hypothetical protein [Ktedonobacteraceae bacterium]
MPITRRKRANPPEQPEDNNHSSNQPENVQESLASEQAPIAPLDGQPENAPSNEQAGNIPAPPSSSQSQHRAGSNGDRNDRQDHSPVIEGGRRTARGELFRRPPQPPPQAPSTTFATSGSIQAPTHEISLPLGNLLHLAYNPGYTGSDEARSRLLHNLSEESKAGGRARCWNCGSIAIAYDQWNTRSKTFGEVGIAFCEICGVWSVM